jgi:hypothetical protein
LLREKLKFETDTRRLKIETGISTDGITVSAKGLDMFRLGPVAAGGKIIQSNNMFFANRTSDGCLDVESRTFRICLAEELYDCSKLAMPRSNYTLTLASQLWKRLSEVCRVMSDTTGYVDLPNFLCSLDCPALRHSSWVNGG